MGKSFDYVPVQLTKAFREAQTNEQFLGWLKMQEASMEIEFPYEELPDVRDIMFTKDSLAVVEQKLMELYPDDPSAYANEEAVHRTMRYAYYVGETVRRAIEATWVALPPPSQKGQPGALLPAIDVLFDEMLVQPLLLIRFALTRRTGLEITRVYNNILRLYDEWAEKGRPPREFGGTLREE